MDYDNLDPQPAAVEFCTVPIMKSLDGEVVEPCGKPILTMTWKGTGVCGDVHRKASGRVIEGEAERDGLGIGVNPTGEC